MSKNIENILSTFQFLKQTFILQKEKTKNGF